MTAGEKEASKEDETRVFLSSSPSYSRCSSFSSSSATAATVLDRLVESELDAARALADFAQLALLQSGGGTCRSWGRKGKRSAPNPKPKRVSKTEASLGSEWGKKSFDFEDSTNKLKSPDLVQPNSAVESNGRHKKVRRTVTPKTIKVEQNHELPMSTPQCSTSCVSSGGGKSKHQLSEPEKEAKRLRRILANRESARQTIRRRQAMCDELTKKATVLAFENESMKKEKELIMKEYQLLKDKNQHLKAQIAGSVEMEETISSTPVNTVSSVSEKQQPLRVYNRSKITPFVWSPIVQPLNPIQTQPPLNDCTVPACKLESSDEQGNLPCANGLRPPFYIMPCPWFFPLGNGLYPHPLDSFGLINKQDSINPCQQGSSLKVPENIDIHHPSSQEVITDTTNNSLPDTIIRLAADEGNHFLGSHPSVSKVSTTLKSVEPIPIKCENRLQQDSTSIEESGSSTSNYTATTFPFPENIQGQNNVCHIQKAVDASLAAEARKRRKELTRLKNLNNRQLRLRC